MVLRREKAEAPAAAAATVSAAAQQVVGRCRLTPGTPWFSQSTPRLLSGTFRDFQLLTLKHDNLLSNFAVNCNLRHYTKASNAAHADFAKLAAAAESAWAAEAASVKARVAMQEDLDILKEASESARVELQIARAQAEAAREVGWCRLTPV